MMEPRASFQAVGLRRFGWRSRCAATGRRVSLERLRISTVSVVGHKIGFIIGK